MNGESEGTMEKVEFKKRIRNKPLRKRQQDSDESGNEEEKESSVRNKVEEMKTIQKLRQRPNGVNIIGLALGEQGTAEVANSSDPFNTKSGGMVNMKALKNAKFKQDDAYDTGIGTQFNAETNKRDEDEEMVKYIEEELSKRKNTSSNDPSSGQSGGRNYCSPEEAALQAVPEHLRQSSAHRSEEMLSNQMLSGIPEVDLGIDAKIKNIEATEEAKQKLLWERHRKNDGPSQFVPTNMAVNFVQHNRFNIDDAKVKNDTVRAEKVDPKEDPKGKRKDSSEKATDDYHYERFKKQFRRF
ncbi:telomere length and silencing protein 1 homolog [Diachasma alloeum]|uniref:telomere length and silencing protein 1 homolog n=1 Tax=Diachasma alloeum TaxID=454923 RepID=UPI0007383D5D|nr:telomere length and silencing protein 1 homolog [Diachasma alloeum]